MWCAGAIPCGGTSQHCAKLDQGVQEVGAHGEWTLLLRVAQLLYYSQSCTGAGVGF